MLESIFINPKGDQVYGQLTLKDESVNEGYRMIETKTFHNVNELLFSLISDDYMIGYDDASTGKVSDLTKSLASSEYAKGFQEGLETLHRTIENLRKRGYCADCTGNL